MAADKTIKLLFKTIEGAIADFQKGIPAIQAGVFDTMLGELKGLEVQQGKVLNSVQNLKLILQLRNKLERLILSEGYKDQVKSFIKAFDQVEQLQQQYFAGFNQKFKPAKTLQYLRESVVDQTVNGLVGQGLQINILDKVTKILRDNITTGGSYASLTAQLRDHLTTTNTEGSLERYSKTITTDAINQYSAQYHESIAQDLQFQWGRYIGSNITTTREFCDRLTAKEWVHRSELPTIISGEIDGVSLKLSKSTGLPLGMIPGTDENNFKIRRGGYNCGHQFFWVPDAAVPEAIKQNLKNPGKPSVAQVIRSRSAKAVESLKKRGIEFPDEILSLMPDTVKIVDDVNSISYFEPTKNEIVIGGRQYADNEYYQKKIVLHEGAHAIHFHQKIITHNHVDPAFKKFYGSLQQKIRGQEGEIDNLLWDKGYQHEDDKTMVQQIGILHDTLGSLTKGAYGTGHRLEYYQNGNFSMMEVFAHAITLARLDNKVVALHPALKEIGQMMKEYGSKILKGV